MLGNNHRALLRVAAILRMLASMSVSIKALTLSGAHLWNEFTMLLG